MHSRYVVSLADVPRVSLRSAMLREKCLHKNPCSLCRTEIYEEPYFCARETMTKFPGVCKTQFFLRAHSFSRSCCIAKLLKPIQFPTFAAWQVDAKLDLPFNYRMKRFWLDLDEKRIKSGGRYKYLSNYPFCNRIYYSSCWFMYFTCRRENIHSIHMLMKNWVSPCKR